MTYKFPDENVCPSPEPHGAVAGTCACHAMRKSYLQVRKMSVLWSDIQQGWRCWLTVLLGLLLLVQMSGCGRKTPLKPRRPAMPHHSAAVCTVKAC